MITQQLIDFIKTQLEKGISKEVISKELIANGWKVEDVQAGFDSASFVTANLTTEELPHTNFSELSHFSNPVVASVDTTTMVAKKSSGMFLKILIPMFVLGLIGGGYYFYKIKVSPQSSLSDGVPVIDKTIPPAPVNNVPVVPPAPVVPTIVTVQNALENLARLPSFTFSGSESGKSSSSPVSETFTGGFSNTNGNTCSIARTITARGTTFTMEDRLIGGTTYEFVKGSKNAAINNKWTQIVAGKEDFSLLHLPTPLKDTNNVCGGQLPLLSVFNAGDLIRHSDTEDVYALTLNADAMKVYSWDNLTKNIPGGQVPAGELTIDVKTALPTKITISSPAFPDPLFTFTIDSTNVPFDVQLPAGFVSNTKNNTVAIQGHNVSYPSTWTTKPQESTVSCKTLSCQTAIALSGGLATKLVPNNSNGSDYIYIGENDPTQTSCLDNYSYCKILIPGGDGITGVMVWTNTTNIDIINIAKNIVNNWK